MLCGQFRPQSSLSELLLCYLAAPFLRGGRVVGGGKGVARRIDNDFFCREMSLRMSLIFFSMSFLRCRFGHMVIVGSTI